MQETQGLGSVPGWRRSFGVGNDNLLQCSCLGNPMDRETWQELQSMELQRIGQDWAQTHIHNVGVYVKSHYWDGQGRPHWESDVEAKTRKEMIEQARDCVWGESSPGRGNSKYRDFEEERVWFRSYLNGLVVFYTFFSFSLNLAIRSSWSEPQSAPGLIFADCIELLYLWLQRI